MSRSKIAFLLGFALFQIAPFLAKGQKNEPFLLHFWPILNQKGASEQTLAGRVGGDSLVVQTFRFYVGNFVFLKNGQPVSAEKSGYFLLDLEDEKSFDLALKQPAQTDFDALRFDLGIDSATNVSGAMGGDLDPTRGMFWTWQSGYINFKIEGFSQKSPARNGEFQFHLGGFLPPFQTQRTVRLPVFSTEKAVLQLDLTPFFEKIDWQKKPNIMSPCAEAVGLMDVLSNSFRLVSE